MTTRRATCSLAAVVCAVVALAGCGSSARTSGPAHSAARVTSAAGPPAAATVAAPRSPATVAARRPVIVIDPGHSRAIYAIDPRTGLNVSDYANEPEMRDVYSVARLVRAKLTAAGYRVVMTKKSVKQRVSLGRRAEIANKAHADLALSIHDQAGRNGGIRFSRGNNIVYYQKVGDYRATPRGKKVYFKSKHVAALSRKYGRIFRTQRHRVEHQHIQLRGNVGYNLGSRGLAAGNIWLVQLLSKVPWIYNESGGNSAGRSGLDSHDKHVYANALVAAVEHCIPPPH